MKGIPLPKEESPNRPNIEHERFESMLRESMSVDPRFHVALVLAHETGHRIGAIRQLRWSDVDLERSVVRWLKHNDKIGMEHETTLTGVAVTALGLSRSLYPGIGDAWVLSSPKDPSEPCSRHLMRDWWRRAEERAGLAHVKGLGWHSLRRKFATELKEVPLKDLCELGGWKSPETVLQCYQQPDVETMRQALAKRRTLTASGLK